MIREFNEIDLESLLQKTVNIGYKDGKRFVGKVLSIYRVVGKETGLVMKNVRGEFKHIKLSRVEYLNVLYNNRGGKTMQTLREKNLADAKMRLVLNHGYTSDETDEILMLIIQEENVSERAQEHYDFVKAFQEYGEHWGSMKQLMVYMDECGDEPMKITELWGMRNFFPLSSGDWISWRY